MNWTEWTCLRCHDDLYRQQCRQPCVQRQDEIGGGGLYASALFESGAYIDLIGKYIHHDNDYTGNFAGLGTKHYNTHSWYAVLKRVTAIT